MLTKPLAGLEARLRCVSHETALDCNTFRACTTPDGQITRWNFLGEGRDVSVAQFVQACADDESVWQLAFDTRAYFGPLGWPLVQIYLRLKRGEQSRMNLTIEPRHFTARQTSISHNVRQLQNLTSTMLMTARRPHQAL